MRTIASATLAAVAATTIAFGQCSPSGLSLGYQGTRLGDPFFLNLTGTPGVAGLIGVDVAGGTPNPTPIGNVCLGLTQALQLLPFALNGTGQYSLGGMLPPVPALAGWTGWLQAGATDPTQPSGTAISNSTSVTLQPPRLYVINYGSPGTGSWLVYDGLTTLPILGPIGFPGIASDAVLVPALGWIAFYIASTTGSFVACFDATTGAPTLTVPTIGSWGQLAATGTTLAVLSDGAPSRVVTAISLPSGAVSFTTPLVWGTTDIGVDLLIPPGANAAYVRGTTSVTAVNLASGVQLPPIFCGGTYSGLQVEEWALAGPILYTLVRGGGSATFPIFGSPAILQAIDVLNHVALHPAPVPMPFNGLSTMLRYGPGPSGNCLFLQYPNTPGGSLMRVNPFTLAPIGPIPGTPPGLSQMALSPGGSEWLLVCDSALPVAWCTSGGPWLETLQVPAMTFTTVTSIPAVFFGSVFLVQALEPIPSASQRRAVMMYGLDQLAFFSTDPTAAPTTTVTLPSMGLWHVLVD